LTGINDPARIAGRIDRPRRRHARQRPAGAILILGKPSRRASRPWWN